jgi:integrase
MNEELRTALAEYFKSIYLPSSRLLIETERSKGGSLRDVQMLAGHTNLRTTQRYIEANPEAQVRIVELI